MPTDDKNLVVMNFAPDKPEITLPAKELLKGAIDASPVGSPDHDFFAFLTGVIGQKIILQTGIVPASVPIRVVELQ